jgi:HSP20 family molecular chaperone IbpA
MKGLFQGFAAWRSGFQRRNTGANNSGLVRLEALCGAREEEMTESALLVMGEPAISIEEEPIPLIEDGNDLYDLIARRAFEIFEGNGRLMGRDLADWLQAESEVLHPLHIKIDDSPGTITVRADVPGFKEADLKVKVEPDRVTIHGTRKAKKEHRNGQTVYSEACADQVFRQVDLPATVDAKKVKTTVRDGVLELELAKAEPDKHGEAVPKTA